MLDAEQPREKEREREEEFFFRVFFFFFLVTRSSRVARILPGAGKNQPLKKRIYPYLTTWLDSESIWSRETSRRAVEGTPSSSICFLFYFFIFFRVSRSRLRGKERGRRASPLLQLLDSLSSFLSLFRSLRLFLSVALVSPSLSRQRRTSMRSLARARERKSCVVAQQRESARSCFLFFNASPPRPLRVGAETLDKRKAERAVDALRSNESSFFLTSSRVFFSATSLPVDFSLAL